MTTGIPSSKNPIPQKTHPWKKRTNIHAHIHTKISKQMQEATNWNPCLVQIREKRNKTVQRGRYMYIKTHSHTMDQPISLNT